MSKYVEFYRLDPDGSKVVSAGKAILDRNGGVKFSDVPVGLVDHLSEGILDGKGKKLMPSDGMVFMDRLKYEFSGTYLRASDIKED